MGSLAGGCQGATPADQKNARGSSTGRSSASSSQPLMIRYSSQSWAKPSTSQPISTIAVSQPISHRVSQIQKVRICHRTWESR